MKFGFSRQVVSEEKMFENVDTQTYTHTHGRQRATYTIRSSMSLKAKVS